MWSARRIYPRNTGAEGAIGGILNNQYSFYFLMLVLLLKLLVTVVCLSMGFLVGFFHQPWFLEHLWGYFYIHWKYIGVGMLGSSLILAGMGTFPLLLLGPIATILLF